MKSLIITLFLLTIVGVGCMVALRQQSNQDVTLAAPAQTVLRDPKFISPTEIATATTEPTATVGYQATTDAAQATTVSALQTASAAIAQQAQATNDHEARVFSLAQMTASMDAATATAALTSIPLTATQQAAQNTLAASVSTQSAEHMLATQMAPSANATATQIVIDTQYAPVRGFVSAYFPIVGWIVFLAFAGAAVAWVAWIWWKEAQPAEPEYDINELEGVPAQPSAPVRGWERLPSGAINRDTDPPGDCEKFRALIAHSRAGGYLGTNVVVAETEYTSNDDYKPVIEWLEKHLYISQNSKGGKVFNSAGRQFVSEWEVRHAYPPRPTGEDVTKQTPIAS